MMTEKTEKTKDTATYKPVTCYCCGGQMGLFKLKDTWRMRVDGQLHMVPVISVPCLKCLECGTTVLDGCSDEAVHWSYKKYIRENGLDTSWLRARRFIRRKIEGWQYWYWNRLRPLLGFR